MGGHFLREGIVAKKRAKSKKKAKTRTRAESLVEFVNDNVDPVSYYETIFPDNTFQHGDHETRVLSPFIDEKTPSLAINTGTGKWHHFCGTDEVHFGGKGITSFHAKLRGFTLERAAQDLYHEFIKPIIPRKKVVRWINRLKKTPSIINYIKKERLLDDETIERFEIGFDGKRITIPVKNEYGLYVNIKLYDPTNKQTGGSKMINYSDDHEPRKFGKPMLFPLSSFRTAKEEGQIVICEGEWDCLFLLSLGIPAITTTAGSKSWCSDYNNRFMGMKCIIAYDNDNAGQIHWRKYPYKNLNRIASEIWNYEIPKKYGKDVLDWAQKKRQMRSKQRWLLEFKKAKFILGNDEETLTNEEIHDVPLDTASEAKWHNKRVRIKALISGKGEAPYILPKKFRCSCDKIKQCETCPMKERKVEYIEKEIDPSDPEVLKMVHEKEHVINKMLLGRAGFSEATPECNAKIERLTSFNVENVLMIPGLHTGSVQYVTRNGFYTGHGLHANRTYEFEGMTTTDPKTQKATHLFDSAKPVQGEVETFKMSQELKKRLKVFQATGKFKRGSRRNPVIAKLTEIADWQSRNITGIKQRPDLHITTDLVIHSVNKLRFNNELIERGMLDVIIFGDTRCGKGDVADPRKGIAGYYELGVTASGENCSFAGLVGGSQKIYDIWMVTWGLIPLNNGRFVVIDEASSLTEADFAKMSRVRSEGIAEITKISGTHRVEANTRLLWLANPRSGRPIMSYNTGVEAIKELIGANEDVSRFDFAMTVASDEVSPELINQRNDGETHDKRLYPAELCRQLVLWAWSRTEDQIHFTEEAEGEVLRQALKFGKKYSSAIPLVQAENIRIKIAKISAAVAARVFSTDEAGDALIIKEEHVIAACNFIQQLYSKPSMNYEAFSQTEIETNKLADTDKIMEVLNRLNSAKTGTMDGLLKTHRITADALADYTFGDVPTAKNLIADLVGLRCMVRVERGNFYLKNQAFTKWLRAKQKVNKAFAKKAKS